MKRRWRAVRLSVAAAVVLATACGSSDSGDQRGGDGTAGDGPGATCDDMVRANCAWQARCDATGTLTVDACLKANAKLCSWYALPGVAADASLFQACITRFATSKCGLPLTCGFRPGTIAPGGTCTNDHACSTGLCYQADPDACGMCALDGRHSVGGTCSIPSDCSGSLDCVAGICTEQQKQEGGACGGERTCFPAVTGKDGYLACVDGACKLVARLGEPCYVDSGGGSYCGAGTVCSFVNQLCVPLRFGAPGEGCGSFAAEYVACRGFCQVPAGSTGDQGTCVALPGVGESCHKLSSFEECADNLTCDSAHDQCVVKETAGPRVTSCP